MNKLSAEELKELPYGTPVMIRSYSWKPNHGWVSQPIDRSIKRATIDGNDWVFTMEIKNGIASMLRFNPQSLDPENEGDHFYEVFPDLNPLAEYSYGEKPTHCWQWIERVLKPLPIGQPLPRIEKISPYSITHAALQLILSDRLESTRIDATLFQCQTCQLIYVLADATDSELCPSCGSPDLATQVEEFFQTGTHSVRTTDFPRRF